MENRDGLIWFDGEFVDWKSANIHILNHGLHYASSVFEGERSYSGKIFKVREHTERLFSSADALDLKIPFSIDQIIDASYESIKLIIKKINRNLKYFIILIIILLMNYE